MGVIYKFEDSRIIYQHTIDPLPDSDSKYFAMHAHDRCELLYIISGRVSYIVEGSEYRLKDGALILTREGETHRPVVQRGYAYERMMLQFEPELLREIDPQGFLEMPFFNRSLGTYNLYPRTQIRSGFLFECMKSMERTGSSQEQRMALMANFPSVLAEVHRVYCKMDDPVLPQSTDFVQEIIAYINQHLGEELSLDLLSKQFYLSKPQLSRRFKEVTGSSIWEFITIKRLSKARGLLRAGEAAMQVSEQCGFQNYSVFYRAYRSRYGHSPQQEKAYANHRDSLLP